MKWVGTKIVNRSQVISKAIGIQGTHWEFVGQASYPQCATFIMEKEMGPFLGK